MHEFVLNSLARTISKLGFLMMLVAATLLGEVASCRADETQREPKQSAPSVAMLNDEECWKRMPTVVSGSGQALPSWAKAVASQLPRTAAAMLQLDLAHRTKSPLDPVLRGKMRWVIAHANRCVYSEAYALADLKRAGVDASSLEVLKGAAASWSEAGRDPLEFARLLTVAAPTISDELFERLRSRFGDKQVAAMVLLGGIVKCW